MREQDADLLESNHYAASLVSQYSPGGTPLLRPQDRSLPLEDVPPLMLTPQSKSTTQSPIDGETALKVSRQPSQPNSTILQSLSLEKGVQSHDEVRFSVSGPVGPVENRFRRLLSGEVCTIDANIGEQEMSEPEGKEMAASPVGVAQEAGTVSENGKSPGLAEQRRVSEAMQFAEAVGELISTNQKELCIIEDHTDGGESDDSDDEDVCDLNDVVLTKPKVSSNYSREDALSLTQHVEVLETPDRPRRKWRPAWPFGSAESELSVLESLHGKAGEQTFAYKGICANPPEITKRGIQRGNYAQLHRKAWLEVSDKYHRYGKNLRSYYRYWERLDFPTNQFFDWLDSKGEAAGQPLPNLADCPRSVLDSDTVKYITKPEVTESYAIDIICEGGRGRVIDIDEDPVTTGNDGWIFVLRDNVLYAAEKITSVSGHLKQRFHHSSFFGGKAVASAGILITDEEGYLTRLYPHSGHYRPGEAHVQRMLFFLQKKGTDLKSFEVDTQQFSHVARDKDPKSKEKDAHKKQRKVDNLHLQRASTVACFLSHKAKFIGEGIFKKIHTIRKADVTTVSEALQIVDKGGFAKKC
ncbi:MAG: hypothetical protein SGBAC_012594 [Bacillariaceae sp.]